MKASLFARLLTRLILFLLALTARMPAQQAFLTDDADVAGVRHFHLELLTEHDLLQPSAYPTLRQNTTRLQLTYGLLTNLEIGFDGPLLFIYNAPGTSNAFGFGDLDLQVKYRLRAERGDSRLPAMTLGLYIEVPTSNPRNQLGSGIA